jgi:hypothetical protein
MAVEIITEGERWTLPPRSTKESAYRVTHRADGRWVAQATSHERYANGGEWFTPFLSVLTPKEACIGLVRRMATQIKDKAYLHEVAHAITRATGAPPPDDAP